MTWPHVREILAALTATEVPGVRRRRIAFQHGWRSRAASRKSRHCAAPHRRALIVDEAHAVGIYGAQGSGLDRREPASAADVFLSINTAWQGARRRAARSSPVRRGPIEYLIQRATAICFLDGAAAAGGAALDASLSVLEQEPERRSNVRQLARYAARALRRRGDRCPPGTSHIIPVIVGGEERAMRVAEALQADGFDVRAIRPPTVPAGTARLRLSMNVAMTEPILDRLARRLASALERTTPCSAASS